MTTVRRPEPVDLVTAAQARELLGVSDTTLWRWECRKGLGFPKAVRINDRRYWGRLNLEAFKARNPALFVRTGGAKGLPHHGENLVT